MPEEHDEDTKYFINKVMRIVRACAPLLTVEEVRKFVVMYELMRDMELEEEEQENEEIGIDFQKILDEELGGNRK